jgi:hypothetical protein
MTEVQWLCCTDPTLLLAFLQGKVSDRKWRLYLCGGCRHMAHLYFRPESLKAVLVAERFADGEASKEELDRAEWDAEAPTFGYDFNEGYLGRVPGGTEVLARLVELGALPASVQSGGEWQVNEAVKEQVLAAAELAEFSAAPCDADWGFRFIAPVDWPGHWLFDCVFGNPFRPLPSVADSLLDWHDGLLIGMAEEVDEERSLPQGTLDVARLAVLCDALEEAGFPPDHELLLHLRGPGPHVRGCWAIDVLTARE